MNNMLLLVLATKPFTPCTLTQPTRNHFVFLVDIEIRRLVQTKHIGTLLIAHRS
jgi:hypothetical protein